MRRYLSGYLVDDEKIHVNENFLYRGTYLSIIILDFSFSCAIIFFLCQEDTRYNNCCDENVLIITFSLLRKF